MTESTAPEPAEVHLDVSNDLGAIAFARMVVRSLLPPLDKAHEPLFYGALTEIVTNAIEEHRRIGSESNVRIVVTMGSEPAIIVSDAGEGFDPDAARAKGGDSGLGLMISRTVVPDLRVESGATGTTVTLPHPGERT